MTIVGHVAAAQTQSLARTHNDAAASARTPLPSRASSPGAAPGAVNDTMMAWPQGRQPPTSLRPVATRMASQASSVGPRLPPAEPDVVCWLQNELTGALRDVQATTGVKFLAHWRGKRTLRQVAKKLAGVDTAGCDRQQTEAVVAKLHRPDTAASAAYLEVRPVLANTAATLSQYSLAPVYVFAAALMRASDELLEGDFAGPDSAETTMLLRRTAYALAATLAALDSYAPFSLSPGFKELHHYQAAVRSCYEATKARLLAPEVASRPLW